MRKRFMFADAALRRATTLWFVVAVFGQWMFAYYAAWVYGTAAARGGIQSWSKMLFRGYIPGDPFGNTLLVLHLLLGVLILAGGPLQFITAIRRRAPAFHRWNGRFYMASVIIVSVGGAYMIWSRDTIGDDAQHAAQTLNALLVVIFAALALRHARARDFSTHRCWALRLFLAANAVWFFRVGSQLWVFLFGRAGINDETFSGPFLITWQFGAFLLPLAILEIYLRTVKSAGARGRLAMAAALVVLTVGMGIGIYRMLTLNWLPRL